MKKICLALDGLTAVEAFNLTQQFGRRCHAVKVHDLPDTYGPRILNDLADTGIKVWVDYKLHDTKDTVALRVKALIKNDATIITVHASGGIPMMRAAVETALSQSGGRAEIWAVTVLTSLDDAEIARIYGKDRTREEIVHEFALMAKEAGIRSVVCSAQEVGMLSRSPALAGMQFVVPGTRSAGVALGQQKRSGTPRQAVDDGATLLVAGSQVTEAVDPVAAFDAMEAEVN
jgi:orotidine-5'-phosphate decarboxylase